MSLPNMAPSESILCILLLSFTLPLLDSNELSSSGYFTISAKYEDIPKETIVPAYFTDDTEATDAPAMDTTTTSLHATTRAPTYVTAAMTITAPTSGAMTTMPFSSVPTHDRSIVETVLTEATTVAMPTFEAAVTSSVRKSVASEAAPHATEGTLYPTTTTHVLDPTVDVLTSLPPTTNKSLTSAILPSIGLSTKGEIVDFPTPEATRAALEPSTERITKPSTSALTNSAISPLVYGIGQPALTTTTIPYTSGLTLAPGPIKDQDRPSLLWILTLVFLAGVVCVGGVLCLCLLIKRKKQSQVKHFGSSSSQRSKWKKGVEDDAWAGPVKLSTTGGWEECEGGEDGWKAEEGEKEGDGVGLLNTFITNETEREGTNGGVGERGSKEVKKWEQEAPLLYIDEDTEEETPKPVSKTNPDGDKEGKMGSEKELGKKEIGEGKRLIEEMDEGTTYCLTTAV